MLVASFPGDHEYMTEVVCGIWFLLAVLGGMGGAVLATTIARVVGKPGKNAVMRWAGVGGFVGGFAGPFVSVIVIQALLDPFYNF
jgi:hypothetical protein